MKILRGNIRGKAVVQLPELIGFLLKMGQVIRHHLGICGEKGT